MTYIAWVDNVSITLSFSESGAEEEKILLMVDHDLSNIDVSSTCDENDYDDLYDAFQQLLVKSHKLDTTHKKLKYDFKELQSKFKNFLEKRRNLKKLNFNFRN